MPNGSRPTWYVACAMERRFARRLDISQGQERLLEQQLELCRWVYYNQTLAVRRDAWEERLESLGLYDTNTLLPQWKRERPDLKRVHSQVLQNIQVRVNLAFKAFFRRLKAAEKPGYPRFKGKGRYDSLTYPQYGNGARVNGNTLTLSKIGTVRFKQHRPIEGTIKTVTLRRTSTGKWFVCFSVEQEPPQPDTVPDGMVGVDVGLTTFATLSTEEAIPNPRFFRHDEKDLARAQRKLGKAKRERLNGRTPQGGRPYSRTHCQSAQGFRTSGEPSPGQSVWYHSL